MPRDFQSPPTNSSFRMDNATMFLRLDPKKIPPKPQNPQFFMISKLVFYIQQQQQQQHSKHTLQQVVLTSIKLKRQFAGGSIYYYLD